MTIGYDGKKAVYNMTGIGNYSRRCLWAISSTIPVDKVYLLSPDHSKINTPLDIPTGVRTVTPPWPMRRGIPYEIWRIFLSWKKIKKLKMDIFHGLSNELPFWIDRSNCRSVVTIHDLIFLRHPEWYDKTSRNILKQKTQYACRVADKIIAVSQQTKKDIIHFYGVSPERISVIYQSYDPMFDKQLTHEMVRMKCDAYNLPKNYILCVGTIEQRKNQEILIKMLHDLPRHLSVVLVGKESPYQEQLRQMALSEKLINRVYFRNHVLTADLPAFYQGARMMAYMSHYEGFGIPVVEALASGVPVIAATGSCLEEAGGPNSIYISPNSPAELAKAIIKVDSDEELRQHMIEQGKKYSLQFSDIQFSRNMMTLYNSIVNG